MHNINYRDLSRLAQDHLVADISIRAAIISQMSEQHGAWGAKVNLDGKQHHAGFHDTPEEAHQAYLAKKRELHPFCTI